MGQSMDHTLARSSRLDCQGEDGGTSRRALLPRWAAFTGSIMSPCESAYRRCQSADLEHAGERATSGGRTVRNGAHGSGHPECADSSIRGPAVAAIHAASLTNVHETSHRPTGARVARLRAGHGRLLTGDGPFEPHLRRRGDRPPALALPSIVGRAFGRRASRAHGRLPIDAALTFSTPDVGGHGLCA